MTEPTVAAEAFELAFGDLPFDQVLALREGIAWRHLPATDPDRFRHLLSVAHLDAFLRTDAARTPRVGMADAGRKGGAGVPHDEFTDNMGRVDLPRLLQRFDRGGTLVVSQFHDMHEPLARFCRGLEKAFLHGVQSNIYLTPPGAQGFRAHFDTHDVIVMQVSGQKTWRVWDGTPFPVPTRRTPWDNQNLCSGEPHSFTLEPGAALYIPRGVMHDAMAQEVGEPSLHLTIGLLEPAWAEMLGQLIDAIEQKEPLLRASFPTWRLADEDGIARVAAALSEVAATIAKPELAETLAVMALDRVSQDRMPLPGRGLLPAQPAPRDRMRLTDTMHHHIVPLAEGGAALRWHGGAETLSEQELAWMERLEDGASAEELGEGGLAFLTRLAAPGLIEKL